MDRRPVFAEMHAILIHLCRGVCSDTRSLPSLTLVPKPYHYSCAICTPAGQKWADVTELTQFYCYLCIVVFVLHLAKVPAVAVVLDDGSAPPVPADSRSC